MQKPNRRPANPRLFRLASAVALYSVLGPVPLAVHHIPLAVKEQRISATRLEQPRGTDGKSAVGALFFVEGWKLTSRYTGFGGFSGIALTGPRTFLLAADTGLITRFTLDRAGHITHSSIAPLPDGPGDPTDKHNRDVEALTNTPDGRHYWFGFEHTNAIYRFGATLAKSDAHARPRLMKHWRRNGGVEAMTRLADGRFIVFSEDGTGNPKGLDAIMFRGDPAIDPDASWKFFYNPGDKGQPTDVQQLPDGRLLILHRSFAIRRGFISTIAIADIGDLTQGSILTSRTIARFAPPYLTENFEGMALVKEGKDLMLWLVSDNNLNNVQRSLLVKFRIDQDRIP